MNKFALLSVCIYVLTAFCIDKVKQLAKKIIFTFDWHNATFYSTLSVEENRV
jgi:hypothetical protein